MLRCPECRSFVPNPDHRCPNCAFSPSPSSKRGWWLAPLGLLGASAFQACIVAIYGAPCTSAALGDGGIDECSSDVCNHVLPDGGIKANDPEYAVGCKAGATDGGKTDGGE